MGFWSDRRVLVTGGAGFIGSHLAGRLQEAGARVRVADSLDRTRQAPTTGEGTPEFHQVDLRIPDDCARACRDQDVVFHLASRAGSWGFYLSHAGSVLLDNLLIDQHVLRAARESGVGRYLYISSSMVYPLERQQTPDAAPLREEDALPANPPNSYGWAKLIGERAVASVIEEGGHLRGAILRLENVYGPGQDMDLERGSVIPVLLRRAIEYPRVPFLLRGTGQETRSYCYITDAVDAMMAAVERLDGHQLLGPLNVTGEERVRILDLAHTAIRLSGKAIEITHVPGTTTVWGQALDCSRARAVLGFAPRVPLEEGLRRCYDDVRARVGRAFDVRA